MNYERLEIYLDRIFESTVKSTNYYKDNNLIEEVKESENFNNLNLKRLNKYLINWNSYLNTEQQERILKYTTDDICSYLFKQIHEIVLSLFCHFEMALYFDNENNENNVNLNALYYCKRSGINELKNLFLITQNITRFGSYNDNIQMWLLACNQAYLYQEVLLTARLKPRSELNAYTKRWISNSTATELVNEMYVGTYKLIKQEHDELKKEALVYIKNTKYFTLTENELSFMYNKKNSKIIKSCCKEILKNQELGSKLDFLSFEFEEEQLEEYGMAYETGYVSDKIDRVHKDYLDPNIIWFITPTELQIKRQVACLYNFDLYFDYILMPFCYRMRREYKKKFRYAYGQHIIRIQDPVFMFHMQDKHKDDEEKRLKRLSKIKLK